MSDNHNPLALSEPSQPTTWTEGDIPRRQGTCNVLLIAPHGRPEDDTNTGKLARELADRLDCYAVINEKYIKTSTAGVPKADPKKSIADLYKKSDAELPEIKPLFLDHITHLKSKIIYKYKSLLILHIHGIRTTNTPKVAKLIPDYKNKENALQLVIGYGQWKNEDSRFTADTNQTVIPLIKRLRKTGLESAIAPTDPIKVKGKKIWYCGWSESRLNQALYDAQLPMQSIQIEFKGKGVRDNQTNRKKTVGMFAEAIKPFLVSAVQNDAIQQIRAGDIDLDNEQFKARIDEINSDSVEFKRLVKSVETDGVLNNIIVRELSDQSNGKLYQLISGFRRMAALNESKNGADNFETTTVMAKILKASVSNDDAYRISFTENLARKDLSLWEIAQACAEIKKKMEASGKPKGDIDNHIANLIQKDPRTVRRYLKLATIINKDIQKAVHSGNISPTMALEIGKTDLVKDDPDNISALLNYLDAHPKTTRQFEKVYSNLEFCCECSKMPLPAVLTCKNADDFLSLKKKELEKRVEHLRSKTGKEYTDILKGRAGSLIKETGDIDAGLKKKDAAAEFKKNHKNIVDKINEAFHKSDIDGKFKIKLAPASGDDHVTVTITVPENQVWQAFDAVSGANNSNSGRNVRKGDM